MIAVTGGKVARGAVWMMTARVTDRLIGLASTLILARVLTPADFGLVAMAMAVIGLIELATAFGFEIALVRMAQPTRAQYDTVWTLNVLFGVGCATATAIAAAPAAAFYNEPRLASVMVVLAFSWLVGSFANVGTVEFRRQLDFAKEFRFLMATRAVTFVITISAALLLRSYWALISGMLAGRVANVAFSYLWHPYRPRPCLQAVRELFSFSVWLLVEKVASFGNSQASDFVLGRTNGAVEVGVYRLGAEIGYLPGSELVAPINRALLPGASRLVEQGRDIVDVLITATGIAALVVVPACIGIAAVAGPVVRVMLGEQWLGAIPVVQIMALNALLVALWANQQTSLLAAGLPKLPGVVAVGRLVLFAPLVFALAPSHGASGVAIAALISSAIVLPIGIQISLRRLAVQTRRYAGAVWRPLVASGVMFVAIHALPFQSDFGSSLRIAGELAAEVGLGFAVYVITLGLLFLAAGRPQGAEVLVLDKVKVLLRR